MANFFLVQPYADAEGVLARAQVVPAGALPQTISGLASGSYRVASLAYAAGGYEIWGPALLGAALRAWYDPSDLTTLFQDAAMTVPVTAAGQSVAAMRDKSGNGRHLTQAIAAARPIYGRTPATGRRNRLGYSEDITNGLWIKGAKDSGVTPLVAANASLAPDGTLTADKVTLDRGAVTGLSYVTQRLAMTGQTLTSSFYVRASRPEDVGRTLDCWCFDTVVRRHVSIVLTAEWVRIVLAPVALNAGGPYSEVMSVGYINVGSLSPDTGVTQFDLWGAQAENAASVTPYQRVVSGFDVTEAGVETLHYLQGDGIDDALLGAPPVTAYPLTLAAAFELLDAGGGGVVSLHQGGSDYKALNIQSYLRAVDSTAAAGYQAANTGSGLPTRTSAVAEYTGTGITLTTPAYSASSPAAQTFGAPVDLRIFSLRGSERTSARIFALVVVNLALSPTERTLMLDWLDAQSEVIA